MNEKLRIALANAGLDQWHAEMKNCDECFGIFVCILSQLQKEIGGGDTYCETVNMEFQRGEILMLTLAVQKYIEDTYMGDKDEN